MPVCENFHLRPYGPRAWLVESDFPLQSLAASVEKNPPPHFQEWVAGHASLLLIFRHPVPASAVRNHLESLAPGSEKTSPTQHRIPVDYSGPDLARTAEACRLTPAELIALHSGATYRVDFLGFAPGFAYLEGLPEKLHLPRRANPRTRMEAGAVAIGGPHAGIYTVPSPGGWHWLGHTDHPLFDPHSDDESAFLFRPGDQVKFVPA